MRLLMIEAKAPLYTLFTETSSGGGAVTIRAFGWQRFYQARASKLIDRSQRPAYLQGCIQHWLSFVLSMTTAALAVVLVATVIVWRDNLDISVGGIGVSLVIIIGLSETLTRLIQSWTKLESSVGAVARVKRYVSETERNCGELSGGTITEWPRPGSIVFAGLTAAYRSVIPTECQSSLSSKEVLLTPK